MLVEKNPGALLDRFEQIWRSRASKPFDPTIT
jgi:hypothetical protein